MHETGAILAGTRDFITLNNDNNGRGVHITLFLYWSESLSRFIHMNAAAVNCFMDI